MKLPRDLSGASLARKLSQFGYKQPRQTGSHLRVKRREPAPPLSDAGCPLGLVHLNLR